MVERQILHSAFNPSLVVATNTIYSVVRSALTIFCKCIAKKPFKDLPALKVNRAKMPITTDVKVYVTCFWEDDITFFNAIKEYGFGETRWKNVVFTLDDDFDRIIILTRPHVKCKPYDARKAITFLTEPPSSLNVRPHATSVVLPAYLPMPFWDKVTPRDKKKILQVNNRKTKLFSSVTSDLCVMEGHQRRLELIYRLDKVIEEGFHIWGKNYSGQFFPLIHSYKGMLADKYKALWPYQYHFACENSFVPGYFTEKIVDPIIAECLCFYDGCLNISEFIDERAFVKINVEDQEKAISTIIENIQHGERKKRLKYIREQKKRLLYDLNPLNFIWMAVNEKDVLRLVKL